MTFKRLGALAAVMAAAVFCALSASYYAQARTDDTLALARARDTALDAGRREITELNTVDTQHVEEWLRERLDVTAGPLHDQMLRATESDRGALQQSGASARGTVTDAALTALDPRAGTARMLATVEVRVTPTSGAPTTDRKRLEVGLERTAAGWRITTLAAVPVASPGPQG
ncbi:hypothetical protein OG689_07590 [Kitasatospora sp. NBC_00240]|uniref:hypothetical protein n=1 Tax=Kitasatospora sp. NBC_00240 TaxID=2903567 RepID=UPI002253F6E4|nr:hypothetical protein [Kitasatospora sp. NBC_00240]MCX5209148.1 hypothetical protein [Kitasatospora sp. NBC_00240]